MKLELKNKNWQEFVIDDIFKVDKGVYLPSKKMKKGTIPYISAKATENGFHSFIGNPKLFCGNSITIEKIKLTAFYQPYDFYCSHDVTVIKNEFLNKYNAQFICQIINRNGVKYNYGRQAQMNVVKREKIYLPVTNKGNPDYEFMEQYIKLKEKEKLKKFQDFTVARLKKLKNIPQTVTLDEKKWMEFKLQEIFETQKGNQNKMSDLTSGKTPLVSAKNGNNGLKGLVSKNQKSIFKKHCLTLNNDGDGGAGIAYYQPFNFLLDSHVTALHSKKMLSKYALLFISRCITKQRNKFGHGYSLTNNRLKSFKIMLPINEEEKPDFEFMESYMKQIEFDKLNSYLTFTTKHDLA